VKNQYLQHTKLASMRALTLGIGVSLFAFACSSSDGGDDEPVDNGPPPIQTTPTATPTDNGNVPPPPTTNTPPPGLGNLSEAEFEALLLDQCGSCHGPDGTGEGNMNYINDLDALIENGKIVPGDPANSLLFQRIQAGQMPPGDLPEVDDDDVERIETFVSRLEPRIPELCDDQFITFDDIFEAIQSDLFELDDDERPFARYLSVANRYNSGVCAADLEQDIWAMNKTINSLSNQSRIENAEAIDGTDGTVFRVDIRDYGWDEAVVVDGINFDDKWEALIGDPNNVYAVEFEGDQADVVKEEAETTVPLLYVDALVDNGTIGNLYYAFVDVGEARQDLLDLLEINEQEQIDEEIAVYVGTTESNLSSQDAQAFRLQIDTFDGYYWERRDLDADTDDQSIFVDVFNFVGDGAEVVFSLPNGLQGYAIYDAAGVRQEETNLVFDQNQADLQVRVSVSCNGCHSGGLNEMRDEVRDEVERNALDFAQDVFETVTEIYPGTEEVLEVLAEDSDKYKGALGRAEVPTANADPINLAFVRFDRDVNLTTAAGDWGVSRDLLEDNLTRLSVEVDPGLNILAERTLDRDDFNNFYLASLCVLQANRENQPLVADCDDALAEFQQ
jgi:hypothetical protein